MAFPNREKILNAIGLGLLTTCFTLAAAHIFSSGPRSAGKDGAVVIRFAHWQLESGLRAAFDTVARDYETLHPGVRVEQLAIPERIYPGWSKTQLIGGTAPDLMVLGRGDDEQTARFFLPVTGWMDKPNPYNAGTPLAGVAWRDTFIDGLAGGQSYKPNLLEYYGVPASMFTVRIYANHELWRRILGDLPPPADYDAFIDVCERVRRYSARTGDTVIPVAGSRDTAPMLLVRLFCSQTQRLKQTLDPSLTLKPPSYETALGFLRGDWGAFTPAYANGLAITREAGRFFQPGFMQLTREDASFYFIQGRALMIATGSWDAPSFRSQASFGLDVFPLPVPARSHPRFGSGVLGPASEGDITTGLAFSITKQSRHPDQALDFLHYLSSYQGNRTFSRVSGWLPSIVGVKLPPELAPFAPVIDGCVDGFSQSFGADTQRIVGTHIGMLIDPRRPLSDFQSLIRREFPDALRSDLWRAVRETGRNIARQDTLVAANYALLRQDSDAARARFKVSEVTEAQVQQEIQNAWIAHGLNASAGPARD